MSKPITYAQSGVDIEANDVMVDQNSHPPGQHVRAARDRRALGIRRAVSPGLRREALQEELPQPGPRRLHRRRGQQGPGGRQGQEVRHGGHRPGRDERQRHAGDGRGAAVLPGLRGPAQARTGPGRPDGQRGRRRLSPGGLCPAGRRDRGDARHLSQGRLRHGGLWRRRGREGSDHHGQEGPAGRSSSWAWAPPVCTATATPWPGPSASNETSSS